MLQALHSGFCLSFLRPVQSFILASCEDKQKHTECEYLVCSAELKRWTRVSDASFLGNATVGDRILEVVDSIKFPLLLTSWKCLGTILGVIVLTLLMKAQKTGLQEHSNTPILPRSLCGCAPLRWAHCWLLSRRFRSRRPIGFLKKHTGCPTCALRVF